MYSSSSSSSRPETGSPATSLMFRKVAKETAPSFLPQRYEEKATKLSNMFGFRDPISFLSEVSRSKEDHDPLPVKLMLLGDSGVGKSSLLCSWCDCEKNARNKTNMLPTVGLDYRSKLVTVGEGEKRERLKVQIWDTAGQERYRVITKAYYRGTQGILIVFDVTNKKSFANVSGWVKNVAEHLHPTLTSTCTNPNQNLVQFILVGNKIDLLDHRVVSRADGELLANQFGLPYFETSVKTGSGIYECFDVLLNKVVNEYFRSKSPTAAAAAAAVTTPTTTQSSTPTITREMKKKKIMATTMKEKHSPKQTQRREMRASTPSTQRRTKTILVRTPNCRTPAEQRSTGIRQRELPPASSAWFEAPDSTIQEIRSRTEPPIVLRAKSNSEEESQKNGAEGMLQSSGCACG